MLGMCKEKSALQVVVRRGAANGDLRAPFQGVAERINYYRNSLEFGNELASINMRLGTSRLNKWIRQSRLELMAVPKNLAISTPALGTCGGVNSQHAG